MNKINYKNPTNFSHHRDGWAAATRELSNIHDPEGIDLYDWADKVFKTPFVTQRPWCGFLHNVLTYPKEYTNKYTNRILPLKDLVKQDYFQSSLELCRGLYTLSKNSADFLERTTNAKVVAFKHPICDVPKKFDFYSHLKKRKVVTIGQWLRKHHAIYELGKTDCKKILVRLKDFSKDYEEMQQYLINKDLVTLTNQMPNNEYDDLLSSSVVFIDLYDCAACNSVLECIIRNTPILINILPGTVEYLGPDYPFYYESYQEATNKLNNINLIEKTHEYLKSMNKNTINPKFFIKEFISKT